MLCVCVYVWCVCMYIHGRHIDTHMQKIKTCQLCWITFYIFLYTSFLYFPRVPHASVIIKIKFTSKQPYFYVSPWIDISISVLLALCITEQPNSILLLTTVLLKVAWTWKVLNYWLPGSQLPHLQSEKNHSNSRQA
jgi:hypothetical protein